MSASPPFQERLLILMPSSKDAQRTVAVLSPAGIHSDPCLSLSQLCEEIKRGAGAALLTEEVILEDSQDCLGEALGDEPPWSNFPLIVLTHPGRTAHPLHGTPRLNLTLVERPVRFLTLRSVVEAALRHRRQQYEIRDTLLQLTQAQKQLATANRDLENRVQERTRKLQETITELEAFSYTVSHDLRSPLRSIGGYADVLQTDYHALLNEEGQHYLSKIKSGVERLDLLVQDVLAYSRVAKGEIHLEDVDLTNTVNDVIDSYPHLREKGSVTIEAPLPRVRAHPSYLTQCVSNLLGNAVKFARPGVPSAVNIRAEEEAARNQVRIWFEDNGIGIPADQFHEIFQIFGRVHSDRAYEGTGIGLAIVKKAAERMGGSVGLTSELGKGSRFWLSLQRAA